MKWILLAAALCVAAAPAAEAGPPDPTQSSVDPWDAYGAAIMCPGTSVQLDTVRLTVRDAGGLPCIGVSVTIDVSNCNNLCIDTPSGLTGTTDLAGVEILNPRVGGCEACNIVVRAGGVVLRTYTQVISQDWDGSWADGIVNEADSAFFSLQYQSPPKPYSVCSDFNLDGQVDMIDFSLFGNAWLNSNSVTCPATLCSVSPTSIDFGSIRQGNHVDTTFTIKNVGISDLYGDVSETCNHFDITAGGGAYILPGGDSLVVSVRFEPTADGMFNCNVSTGQPLCANVALSGTGDSRPPEISSILDVANDQGRQVRITFLSSYLDTVGSATPILQYEAFRRIDPLPSAPVGLRAVHSGIDLQNRVKRARQGGMRSDQAVLLNGWDYAGAVPAHVETAYNMIAATLADSTISNGMYWSVFFIRAATASPGTYFDSPVDSGYSLDNLAPATPQGFSVAYNSGHSTLLDWEPAPETDFQYFKVYRSTDPNFTPAQEHLVHTTTDDTWLDTVDEGWRYSYKISAVDFAGNESPPASAENVTAVDEPSPLPEEFALYQNVPNPFNPTTSIRFDVPAGGGQVTMRVYDVKGRLVRSLVDGPQSAGHKSVVWNARDAAGRKVASGVYFCHLTAPGYEMTRKMVLLE
jgi:hypothetical protein